MNTSFSSHSDAPYTDIVHLYALSSILFVIYYLIITRVLLFESSFINQGIKEIMNPIII